MMDPGLGLLAALACGLGGVLFLAAIVVVGLRALGGRPRDGLEGARSLLHKRLATGEIDTEEYYERESALRQAEPPQRGRGL
jgi:hypothetical protein